MQKPLNFSFVLPDRLAGMGHPDRFSRIEDQLEYLQANRISAVLSVCMTGLDPEKLRACNMVYRHEQVPDFAAPQLTRLPQLVAWVEEQLTAGRGVVVHCGAGFGRTVTILTAYFLFKDPSLSAYQALNQVRKLRPGSVESLEQEITLYRYAKSLGRPLGPLTMRLRQHSDLELLEYGLTPDCYRPSQDFRE